jgi:hypothetical protein
MKRWIVQMLLWLCVVCMAVTVSCKQEVKKGKYEYYYYPSVNMYYDVADQRYVYSIDSARTWVTLEDTASEALSTLGDKEILYSDSKDVWKQNELHRQQYHGSILHIVSPADEAAKVQNDVRERNVPKKTVAQKPADEKPKKKGIGRFFQKLFGKKKDTSDHN